MKWEPPNEYAGFYFRVGKIDGTSELVDKLLTLRFGPLTEEVRGRVAEARMWELHKWGERLLTAETLDEVFRFPP